MHKSSTGYILEKIHGHPVASKKGYVLQHRRIWFDANGPIPKGNVIHHINGNKTDNRIENLECLTRSQHMLEHYAEGLGIKNGVRQYVSLVCGVCGLQFERKKCVRVNNAKSKDVKLFIPTCNRSCWATLANYYKHKSMEKLEKALQMSSSKLKEGL